MTLQYLSLILLYFKIKPFYTLIYAKFLCDSVYNKRKVLLDPTSALQKTCIFGCFKGLLSSEFICSLVVFYLIFILLVLYPDRPFCPQIPSGLCGLLSPTVYFLDYIEQLCLDPAIFHNSCP
jgi:hypothetical protein